MRLNNSEEEAEEFYENTNGILREEGVRLKVFRLICSNQKNKENLESEKK